MAKSDTLFIAIGGCELSKADRVLEGFLEAVKKKRDPRILVMTVATNEPESVLQTNITLSFEIGV